MELDTLTEDQRINDLFNAIVEASGRDAAVQLSLETKGWSARLANSNFKVEGRETAEEALVVLARLYKEDLDSMITFHATQHRKASDSREVLNTVVS